MTARPDLYVPSAWVGVDLDGTLAHYDRWRGLFHIGPPVPDMADRVRKWVEAGIEVRIVTARVSDPATADQARDAIRDWLARYGLPDLIVTNAKDFGMVELWDDRAVRVEKNTGRRIG